LAGAPLGKRYFWWNFVSSSEERIERAKAGMEGTRLSEVEKVTPDMFPGDPLRAAAAIYQVVASERPRHWVVLGSDALRRIGVKLDMQRAEIEAGEDMTLSTDYPGAGPAVL